MSVLECPCCHYFPVTPAEYTIAGLMIWKCVNCRAEFRGDTGEQIYYIATPIDLDHEGLSGGWAGGSDEPFFPDF